MKQQRRTILILMAVHAVAVFGLFLVDSGWIPAPPADLLARLIAEAPEILFGSLALSQGSLLAFWAAMSGRRRPWRFLAMVVVLAVVGTCAEKVAAWNLNTFAGVMFVCLLGTAPFFFLLRFLGFELTAAPTSSDGEDGDKHRAMQFSLRSLMAWTTGLAMLLSVLSVLMRGSSRFESDAIEEILIMLITFGSLGLLSMATARTALGSERTWLRFTVLGIALVVVGTALDIVESHPSRGYMFLTVVCSTAWTFGSLWVFRTMGYRLIRRTAKAV